MDTSSLYIILCVLALGQLCAIGLHAWTWRMRQRAIWSLAMIGVLGTLLYYFAIVVGLGSTVVNFVHPQPWATHLESIKAFCLLFFLAALPPAVGFLHLWQLQGCHRPHREGWDAAIFSVFGELSLAWLGLLVLIFFNSLVPVMDNESAFFFIGSFIGTLLVLMIFRPVVLLFLRPLSSLAKSYGEKFRFLHTKVRGDVS